MSDFVTHGLIARRFPRDCRRHRIKTHADAELLRVPSPFATAPSHAAPTRLPERIHRRAAHVERPVDRRDERDPGGRFAPQPHGVEHDERGDEGAARNAGAGERRRGGREHDRQSPRRSQRQAVKRARKTAVTALYAAAPFLLIVAPAGNTKLDDFVRHAERVAAAMLTGSAALDEAVANASISASDVARRKSRTR